jgi:hypothetical protein
LAVPAAPTTPVRRWLRLPCGPGCFESSNYRQAEARVNSTAALLHNRAVNALIKAWC